MIKNIQIELNSSSVSLIPFHTYSKDFTFMVNGAEFKTSKIVANILSPTICRNQANDPTISQFTLNTINKGNFNYFLNLINFQPNNIPSKEIPFIEEVVKILGNTSLIFSHTENMVERTEDNIFDQLQDHLQYPIINAQLIQEDIDFIASNMYKFIEKDEITQLLNLETDIIERIITDSKIQLESEDQLLSIINELYLNDSSYSNLYEHIEFICLSEEKITEFLSIFNIDDLTNSTWKQISKRLQKPVLINGQIEEKRYRKSNAKSDKAIIQIPYQENKNFEGIIHFIQTHSKSGIFKEINITSSNVNGNNVPRNAIFYDSIDKSFSTLTENTWICFDFKQYRVIPKSYTIRSWNSEENSSHPRGWVIEGSNDNNEFEVLDEQRNCPFLNGKSLVHTFNIQNASNKKFQYIRMRSIMTDWKDQNHLDINSIEFNGVLLI